jgi:hypothetical protein
MSDTQNAPAAAWLKGDAPIPRPGWRKFEAVYRDDGGPGHKTFDHFPIEAASLEEAQRFAPEHCAGGDLWSVREIAP